jgi:hypothetical protein
MVGNRPGRLLAAAIERALVIARPGIAPGRFRMSQEENCLHGLCPGKSFENKRLVNCHDTVM